MIGVGLVGAQQSCNLKAQATGGLKGIVESITALISAKRAELAPCGSLASVLGLATRRGKTGGRRLEDDRPLDVKQAQANLEAAYRVPAIRSRLEQVGREVQDEKVRLVYEAAILDEEGYYSARDLKIEQLLQRVK